MTFHVNGNAAIDSLIKAHEFAAADDPTKERNVTAIHAQLTRKDQIPLYVKHRIRPSFYTLHTYYFAEAHIKNRGKAQAMYISPMRDAIDAGLRPTNHTDAVVAPLDQMFMLWSAVNRISRAGAEIGPDQRVTPLEGLKAMTIWAAEQFGEQDAKGSLEAGKLADLVILDKNPLKVDKMAIKDIRVVETIKEGRSISRAPGAGVRAPASERSVASALGRPRCRLRDGLRHSGVCDPVACDARLACAGCGRACGRWARGAARI